MRVAIVTAGRFHVLDLARELSALGHQVKFYSVLDSSRTLAYGLPHECNRWLGPLSAAATVVDRRLGRWLPSAGRVVAAELTNDFLDWKAAQTIEPCDVLIGMAGLSSRTMREAKRRFGARTVCERSSQHILAQRQILAAIPATDRGGAKPSWAVKQELEQYADADIISVPAHHVARSFEVHGVPSERIFRNPFGTNIDLFAPTEHPASGRRRIIMAGTWSLRKGCDVLVEAWRMLNSRAPTELVHVGGLGDAPLPKGEAGFVDLGFIPQQELPSHYAQADVFCLASREEGLAVVQVQALASGLRLVCTNRTGGEDLQEMLPDPSAVTVVPPDDPAALSAALEDALQASRSGTGKRDLLGARRDEFSWGGYARRWDAQLRKIAEGSSS